VEAPAERLAYALLLSPDRSKQDALTAVGVNRRRRSVAKVEDLDPTSSRAVAEYLSVLDDAAFSGATPVEPKVISPTDPAARYTASANSVAGYAYSDNYLIDLPQSPHASEVASGIECEVAAGESSVRALGLVDQFHVRLDPALVH
jgi:hypothetical protein